MKVKFNVKVDEKDLELAVVSPTSEQRTYSKIEYNKAVRQALEAGQLLRAKLDDYMRKQNLWDAERQEEDDKLTFELNNLIKKLQAGKMKKSEGKEIAIQIRQKRNELISHRLIRNQLDTITVEAFGEQAQFDYLVASCTVYNDTGEPYFKNVDAYRESNSTDVAIEAATHMANLLYNLKTIEESFPENKFLKRFGFVDENLELPQKEEEKEIEVEPEYFDD